MRSSSKDISLRTFRGYLRGYGLIRNVMEPYFEQFGISGAQWGVLRVLHDAQGKHSAGLRLTDLCQRLLVKPPSITVMVDRMERVGLLKRIVSATDQRTKCVALAPAGRRLVRQVLRVHTHQIRQVLAGLSRKEQAQLCRLLERMEVHLSSLVKAKPNRFLKNMSAYEEVKP